MLTATWTEIAIFEQSLTASQRQCRKRKLEAMNRRDRIASIRRWKIAAKWGNRAKWAGLTWFAYVSIMWTLNWNG